MNLYIHPLWTCPNCGHALYTYKDANAHRRRCPYNPLNLLHPPHDPNDRTQSLDAATEIPAASE